MTQHATVAVQPCNARFITLIFLLAFVLVRSFFFELCVVYVYVCLHVSSSTFD